MICTPSAILEASKCYCGFSSEQANAAAIYLLCEWANSDGCEAIHWTPEYVVCEWTDINGTFFGTLSEFTANADFDTVSIFTLDGQFLEPVSELSGLCSLPNLVALNAPNNTFTTLDVSAHLLLQSLQVYNGSNLTSINASSCPALESVLVSGNQLGTLNITGDFAITTLDISSNPGVTIIGP